MLVSQRGQYVWGRIEETGMDLLPLLGARMRTSCS
jgi:hypothetical protein